MIHSSFLLLGAHLCKFVFSVVFERCTVASPLELVILPPARQIMRQSAALEPTAGRDGVDGDILPADMICKKLLQAQEDADAGATHGGGVRMEPPGKAQNRAATRQFAEALDAACRRTGGFSLADFATGGPSLPLTTDEVRYYATVMNPATGVEENRSCVFNTRRVCNLLVAKIQRGKKGLGAAAAVTTPTPGAGRPVGEVCGVGVGRSTIGDEVGSNRVGLWGRGGFIGVFFIARDTNTLHRSNRVGLETERSYADGKWVAPTVHWSSDMHSVEYGFFRWYLGRAGGYGTYCFDRFHGVHNACTAAKGRAGIILPCMEWKIFLDLRRGPWKACGNHEVLQEMATELLDSGSSRNVIFRVLATQIAREHGFSTLDMSEDWHTELYSHALHAILRSGIGIEAQRSRWFTFESRAREARSCATTVLFILLYVGLRRGWWDSIATSPLVLHDLVCHEAMVAETGDAGEAVVPIPGEDPPPHVPADAPPDPAGDEDHASNDECEEEEEDDHNKVLTIDAARKKLKEHRENLAKTMHFSAKVLSNAFTRWRSNLQPNDTDA